MSMEHKILQADYHRNGSGGAGFYVALVETTEDGETNTFLCIDFAGEEEAESYDAGRFAVLRQDHIAANNISMYPLTDPDTTEKISGTGGNAWRGADYWGRTLRQPIRDWVSRSYDAQRERWANEREQKGV